MPTMNAHSRAMFSEGLRRMTPARDEPEKLDAFLALYGLKRIPDIHHSDRYGLEALDDTRPLPHGGGQWFFSQPLEVYMEAFRLRRPRHDQITLGSHMIEYLGGPRG